jgi:Ulp1 family protease
MKYVIIPIHERAHWYLAVIVNLCELGKVKSGGGPRREQKPKDEAVSDIELIDSDYGDDDKDSSSPKGILDKFLPKKGTKSILPNE